MKHNIPTTDPLAKALHQVLIANLIDARADITPAVLSDAARVCEVISAAAQMDMLEDLAGMLARWVDAKCGQAAAENVELRRRRRGR